MTESNKMSDAETILAQQATIEKMVEIFKRIDEEAQDRWLMATCKEALSLTPGAIRNKGK